MSVEHVHLAAAELELAAAARRARRYGVRRVTGCARPSASATMRSPPAIAGAVLPSVPRAAAQQRGDAEHGRRQQRRRRSDCARPLPRSGRRRRNRSPHRRALRGRARRPSPCRPSAFHSSRLNPVASAASRSWRSCSHRRPLGREPLRGVAEHHLVFVRSTR